MTNFDAMCWYPVQARQHRFAKKEISSPKKGGYNMKNLFSPISRREFMKYCAGTAAALGLSELAFLNKISEALAASGSKPPVIWLEGQDCAGCTVSLAGSLNPDKA